MFVFLNIINLLHVKRSPTFYRVILFSNYIIMKRKKWTKTWRAHGTSQLVSRAMESIWGLVAPLDLMPTYSFWPKKTINMTPSARLRRSGRKQRNTKTERRPMAEHHRRCQGLLLHIHLHQHQLLCLHNEEGVFHPLNYYFVEVTCIMFRGSYFVYPCMVDLLLLRWVTWCKFAISVWCIYRCICYRGQLKLAKKRAWPWGGRVLPMPQFSKRMSLASWGAGRGE
jgi:hypothetical protein